MKKLFIGSLFVTATTIILFILSQNSQPGSSLYSIRRLEEKLVFLTKRDPMEKAEFYSFLLDQRLDELKTIMNGKQEGHLILPSTLRYATTAGEYVNLIKQYGLTAESKNAKMQFANHRKVIVELSKKYKNKSSGDYTGKFIIDDINYLDIYSKELP